MKEWLTTGQMIDQLKTGDIAEGVEGFYKGTKLEKTDCGEILYLNRDKSHSINNFFELNCFTDKAKWRIIPKFITFGEAMIAHSNKRTVAYHHDQETKYIFEHSLEPNQFKELYEDSICLHELVNGNWTIE